MSCEKKSSHLRKSAKKMPDVCPDVHHCFTQLQRNLVAMAILSPNLQIIYARGSARQFESCLKGKENLPQ